MFESKIDFSQTFKRLRVEKAQVGVRLYTQLLSEAQRDLELFSNCRIEEAKNPTAARIKAFLIGKVIESPMYKGDTDKDSICKMLSSLAAIKTRTWQERSIKTIYKPKKGETREISFRYNDRYKMLVNETDRIVLVFSNYSVLTEDDTNLAPF